MTTEIPAKLSVADFIRPLKGAGVACLLALSTCYPFPAGRKTLERLTGYDPKTITKALDLLVSGYQLADRTGRCEGWVLSDAAHN